METNPYHAPVEVIVEPDEFVDQPVTEERASFLLWNLSVAANLVVPILFAMSVVGVGGVSSLGAFGVGLAIIVFFAIGWPICIWLPRFGRRIIAGAWLVALSQLFPMLQIVAGLAALSVGEGMGIVKSWDDQTGARGMLGSELAGFVVATVTGGLLVLVALVLGAFVVAIRKAFRKRLAKAIE